ncbi:MAG: BrnT family toxin [Candidatus Bipolaricaulota bacterium]|nr:BrnT family toxin [Candidatus Bipolaricaulota bacterium]
MRKHNVTPDEVEEIFRRAPSYRFIETGDVAGEDLYAALGQTRVGRYLIAYFLHKTTGEALVISAREMTKQERRAYARAKKA